jgi:hypothetical protein
MGCGASSVSNDPTENKKRVNEITVKEQNRVSEYENERLNQDPLKKDPENATVHTIRKKSSKR